MHVIDVSCDQFNLEISNEGNKKGTILKYRGRIRIQNKDRSQSEDKYSNQAVITITGQHEP